MKQTLIALLSAVCLLLSANLIAQTQEPSWKIELDQKADWMKILPTGSILVATKSSLVNINPETHETLWELKDIGTVNEESYLEIEVTPFAMFESTKVSDGLRTQTTIIDFTTGRVVFNTKEAEMKILEKTPLLEINALLLVVKQEKKVYLTLLDIESGNQRWQIELPDWKPGLGGLKLSASGATPVCDLEDNILFPDGKILKRLDGRTGNVLWEDENEKTVGRLNFSEDGSTVYVGAGRKVKALSIASGKELWEDPLKITGEFEMFIPASNDEMYVVTHYELNRVNAQTGKPSWKKPYVFADYFKSFRFTDKGILLIGGSETSSSFEYVSYDGVAFWKRPYRTASLVSIELTKNGLLYATNNEANIVDLETGNPIWKKRMSLKGRPVTCFNEKVGLIYSEGNLYNINMETSTYKLLNEDIKVKGKDEAIEKIEILKNGYLLSSSQNMILVDSEGKITYSLYYKPVSAGGTAGKILGAAAKVYATTSNLEVTQDPYQSNTYNIGRSERGDQMVAGINEIIANRKNTFATKNFAYVKTWVEDAGSKKVGIIKVEKETGEEKSKILLMTLDPIYQVDEPSGSLYVITNGITNGAQLVAFGL